jgi:hypothetical protein
LFLIGEEWVAADVSKDAGKKIEDAVELPAYSQENIQVNMRIIYYRCSSSV